MTTNETTAREALHLSGALDINEAESVRIALLEYLGGGSDGRVDLSGVTECDAAGVQLLWAAQRSATQGGCPLEWGPPPPAVQAVCAQLGLNPAGFRSALLGGNHEQDYTHGG